MTSPLSNCPFCDEISSTQATFCPTCGSPLYLNNRYRITNLLAKGETSEVFKAQDVACANQAVTIKRFIQKIPGEKGLASIEDDCKREGRFLAVCNHHSIPRLYDYFSWNENWYLVRSFIDGETLARYWSRARREMRLTLEQILDIGIQVCSTLQYLHNQPRPIIFRDLSPSNIMLAPASAPGERSYHIYLLDFGGGMLS